VAVADAARVLRPYGGSLVAEGSLGVGPAAASGDGGLAGPLERVAPPLSRFSIALRSGPVPGAGQWSHAYADESGTVCTGDRMPFGRFRLLWFGRPGPRNMYDRHWKAVPPLYRNGFLYAIGRDWLAGIDAYNGTVRWERTIAGAGRVALLRDCGNAAVDQRDRLFVAADQYLYVLDGRSGRQLARLEVSRYTPAGQHWGFVSLAGPKMLIGTGTLPDAEMRVDRKEDYLAVWRNNQAVVTSRSVFGLDRETFKPAWQYEPPAGVIVNPTLCVLGGRVCFVESADGASKSAGTGRLTLTQLFGKGKPAAVALDARTGRPLWRTPLELAGIFVNAIYMQGADEVLVLTGTRVANVAGRRLIQYRLIALDARTGRLLWQNDNTPSYAERVQGGHGEQTQHPVIVRGVVYGPGFARMLKTGEPYRGWLWQKSPSCSPMSASLLCAFSRQNGHPTAAEFATGNQQPLTEVTRPSCYLNTLPVGGIVLVPEGSAGCTCGYSIQASLAFYPEQ